VANRKAGEISGCWGARDVDFADEAFHLPGDRWRQGVEVLFVALGDQFHPPVRQVADVAGDRVAARQVLGGVTEADALHVAAE